jgi:hypothetical protein
VNKPVTLDDTDQIEYSDGFRRMEFLYVVIRRNPDRFRFFLDRAEAESYEGELWSRSMYEAADGSINNWSNFLRDTR